jgi:hypothetical protein
MISPTCNKSVKHHQQTSLHQFQNETYRHFLSMLCASVGYVFAEKPIGEDKCKGHR